LGLSHYYPTALPAPLPCDFGCAYDGTAVECWGCGTSGQLGNGVSTSSSIPVYVPGFPPTYTVDLSALQSGSISVGYSHACGANAVYSGISYPPITASAYCWGDASWGALGVATPPLSINTPRVAYSVTGANHIEVSAGYYFTCANSWQSGSTSGIVACWGKNTWGQLGNGTSNTNVNATPTQVSGITNAVEIDTGYESACARLSTGSVTCWGTNRFGELGDGTNTQHFTPVAVAGISNAVQVAMSQSLTCARLATGIVMCWGYGPLGNGTMQSSVPVAATGITDAIDLSVGNDHVCVVHADHSVSCWGGNTYSQLGNNSSSSSATPVRATVVTP
jgi:alpha-tubulin suppressor-like RCC1 family protein